MSADNSVRAAANIAKALQFCRASLLGRRARAGPNRAKSNDRPTYRLPMDLSHGVRVTKPVAKTALITYDDMTMDSNE